MEPQKSTPERRIIYYRGTVQGVGFRYITRRIAAGFRVTGYVQNLPDGRVLVVAEGECQELDRFQAAVMHQLGHYVTNVQSHAEPAENPCRGFEIRF